MAVDNREKTVPPSLDDHLCLGIYSAGMTIQRLYKPVLDRLGITYPQYLVLNLLWKQAPRTVGGMASELDLESSTLTPLLKRLENAGLVERKRNPENERQVFIDLTPDGQALRGEAGCVSQTLIDHAGVPEDEMNRLNKALRELKRNIETIRSGRQ
ncbi:MarR family winged helix-turn-helix transcriptional regulator [Roseibium sp. RKSG952]|uniref:MarR family winged helix-turn-helix transcriptional regulator n=1 Tax=Roseibium sp. RKSG952 TaxID=2529384 RepID=UPI0012BC1616|nr:MarR family transcriptional regulator [Roseibium sp. RKSG952]MTH96088.1 MarR family transcriptional regulator [Roseibium sp. RKSG952]